MNGRRVDHGHDLVPFPQHVLAGLIGDHGFERKAAVKVDAHHRPFPMQGPNVPEQVVAGAALRWVGVATCTTLPRSMVSTPTMRATARSAGAENTSCTEPLWRTRPASKHRFFSTRSAKGMSSCKLFGSSERGLPRSHAMHQSARFGAVVMSSALCSPTCSIAEDRLPIAATLSRQLRLSWSRSGPLDSRSPWRPNVQTLGERK
jgi:hypothetical protein